MTHAVPRPAQSARDIFGGDMSGCPFSGSGDGSDLGGVTRPGAGRIRAAASQDGGGAVLSRRRLLAGVMAVTAGWAVLDHLGTAAAAPPTPPTTPPAAPPAAPPALPPVVGLPKGVGADGRKL